MASNICKSPVDFIFPTSMANITYQEKTLNKTIFKGIVGHGQVAQSNVTVNSEYGSVKLIAE